MDRSSAAHLKKSANGSVGSEEAAGAEVRGGRPGTLLSAMPALPAVPALSGGDMVMPAVVIPSIEPPFNEPMELIEPPASSSFLPFLPGLRHSTSRTELEAEGQTATTPSRIRSPASGSV